MKTVPVSDLEVLKYLDANGMCRHDGADSILAFKNENDGYTLMRINRRTGESTASYWWRPNDTFEILEMMKIYCPLHRWKVGLPDVKFHGIGQRRPIFWKPMPESEIVKIMQGSKGGPGVPSVEEAAQSLHAGMKDIGLGQDVNRLISNR